MGDGGRRAVIPHGEFCYQVMELPDGELQLSLSLEAFGKELRDVDYIWGYKRVLCPYWQVTDHGTVRCEYLAVEAVMEHDYEVHLDQALAHFGTEQALAAVRVSASLLTDEIKICAINLPDENDENDA